MEVNRDLGCLDQDKQPIFSAMYTCVYVQQQCRLIVSINFFISVPLASLQLSRRALTSENVTSFLYVEIFLNKYGNNVLGIVSSLAFYQLVKADSFCS